MPGDVEEKNLAAHVALCAERSRGILRRLARVEYALLGLMGLLLANGDGPLTAALVRLFTR